VWEAQELQHAIMGYLPGYAPRVVCDVPYVGKRWVHQLAEYDRVKGISYWKNYLTSVDSEDITTGPRRTPTPYPYYDAIATARHRAAVMDRPAALRPSLVRGTTSVPHQTARVDLREHQRILRWSAPVRSQHNPSCDGPR
jgi:hypothetical protein